jgi:hypothetical protein
MAREIGCASSAQSPTTSPWSPEDFTAARTPQGSIHDGLWYVSERENMPIDDCCWIVLPDKAVARGIPVSNPIHEPNTLEEFRSQSNPENES